MKMETSKLTSRLHEMLRERRASEPGAGGPAVSRRLPSIEAAATVLGASRWNVEGADCLVVEHEYPADTRHGLMSMGEYAAAVSRGVGGMDMLGGDAVALAGDGAGACEDPLGRLLFFDLETTGLAGGAGTYAFLIGCGYFDGSAFQTRQFFLADYADERDLLRGVTEFLEPFRGVVTFNGRTFDLPIMATRYSMQRLRSPFEDLSHVDMLHPARRLWRRRASSGERPEWRDAPAGRGRDERASCALGALEQAILGIERVGDVPGAEIPGRYFDYIRGGDATPLVDVFAHNRLDLVSLAALTAVVLTMVEGGAEAAHNPRECLALGRLLDERGQVERAKACYVLAARLVEPPWEPVDGAARAEALKWLAIRLRRERRHDEAAVLWQQIVENDAGDASLAVEATEALAIHHEHRSKDLQKARAYALRALEARPRPQSRQALERRLRRLGRKLDVIIEWETVSAKRGA
jgi:uncharacterized protein YprB with RNaseH-like and TPR domain